MAWQHFCFLCLAVLVSRSANGTCPSNYQCKSAETLMGRCIAPCPNISKPEANSTPEDSVKKCADNCELDNDCDGFTWTQRANRNLCWLRKQRVFGAFETGTVGCLASRKVSDRWVSGTKTANVKICEVTQCKPSGAGTTSVDDCTARIATTKTEDACQSAVEDECVFSAPHWWKGNMDPTPISSGGGGTDGGGRGGGSERTQKGGPGDSGENGNEPTQEPTGRPSARPSAQPTEEPLNEECVFETATGERYKSEELSDLINCSKQTNTGSCQSQPAQIGKNLTTGLPVEGKCIWE